MSEAAAKAATDEGLEGLRRRLQETVEAIGHLGGGIVLEAVPGDAAEAPPPAAAGAPAPIEALLAAAEALAEAVRPAATPAPGPRASS